MALAVLVLAAAVLFLATLDDPTETPPCPTTTTLIQPASGAWLPARPAPASEGSNDHDEIHSP